MRAWLQAARPLAHANIAPALVFGQALAFVQGRGFDLGLAVLIHAFGVLDHLFIVFANDVADREVDALNETATVFSGGSRVLIEGKLSPRALGLAAAVAGAGLFALSAMAAVLFDRLWLVAFAACALLLLYVYSFPPLRLSYRGFGEVAQGLGVGVVLPLVGYYGQAGDLTDLPWRTLAPLFLLSFVGNIVTALPDTPSDAAGGKRTWPVQRGQARARRDAVVLVGAALLIAAAVGPAPSPAWLGAAFGLPTLFLVTSLRWLRRGDAGTPACARFVFFLGGAIALTPLSWATALVLRRLAPAALGAG
ncbi:MAG: prenyltransferase [Sandaracinaceae bacterium]